MIQIKAVLFDFDGVIANSKIVHDASWLYALNSVLNLNLKILPEVNTSGQSAQRISETLSGFYNKASEASTILKTKNTYLDQNLQNIEPLPGVSELFNYLQSKNIPYGIASNASKFYIKAWLSQWGFKVKVAYGYEDYKLPKPHPEPYIKLAEFLGVNTSDFNSVLVFEDSTPGLQAALGAGMQTAHIQSHCHVSSEILSQTNYKFKSLKDALQLF